MHVKLGQFEKENGRKGIKCARTVYGADKTDFHLPWSSRLVSYLIQPEQRKLPLRLVISLKRWKKDEL